MLAARIVLLSIQFVQIAMDHGCAKASRRVLVLQYCLAILIAFCKSRFVDCIGTAIHHGYELTVIGFALLFFSGKRMRFRCGEKLACTRDGLRKRRGMLLELHAPWNWGLQVTFSCFVDAVLLCVCMCWDTALELVHQSDVFYSSVLQFYCVVRFSLCRSQWNGCVKVPRCCGCVRGILFLFFAVESHKL